MGATLKILAVDDEPSIATSMHYIFSRPRYELTSACDGNDALSHFTSDSPTYDVIITDNNMPYLTGVDFVRKLRERGFQGKIMVLSAYLTPELRATYTEMNVDVILDKPFNIRDLREKLDLLVA